MAVRSWVLRSACWVVCVSVFVGALAGCSSPRKRAPGAKTGLARSAWPKFAGNGQNTGLGTGKPIKGRKAWEFKTGGAVYASPVLGEDGTLYVLSQDGQLYALRSKTGKRKWAVRVGPAGRGWDYIASPAVSADGLVYVGSADASLYALDAKTGKRIWSFDTGANVGIDHSPTIGADGTVYLAHGLLYALDGLTGQLRRSYKPDIATRYGSSSGYVHCCPAIGDDGSIYVGTDVGFLCLSSRSGKVLRILSESPRSSLEGSGDASIGRDGTVYHALNDSHRPRPVGYVRAYDGKSGTLEWSTKCPGVYTAPTPPSIGPDGTVYVRGFEGDVMALEPKAGKRRWIAHIPMNSAATEAALVVGADGTVYANAFGATIYALDGKTGKTRWQAKLQDRILGFACGMCIGSDGTLYSGSASGTVFAFR